MANAFNLASVDLNLMVVFDAMMSERHLTRAAGRVGLSQPAMSHALRRLRDLMGDDLFVRGPNGMEPTARAIDLADDVGLALERLRGAIGGERAFQASASQRHFRVAMSDASSLAVIPRLTPRLRAEAPGVTLQVVAAGAREGAEHVLSGSADLGIGVHPNLPDGVESEALMTSTLWCIADADHPGLRQGLTRDSFLSLPHLNIEVGQDTGASIDSTLATMGLKRRIVLSLPFFLVAVPALVGTDMLAVLPDGLTAHTGGDQVRVHPLPTPAPEISIKTIWRTRNRHDPGLLWLRRLIKEVSADRD